MREQIYCGGNKRNVQLFPRYAYSVSGVNDSPINRWIDLDIQITIVPLPHLTLHSDHSMKSHRYFGLYDGSLDST